MVDEHWKHLGTAFGVQEERHVSKAGSIFYEYEGEGDTGMYGRFR
jgi:hypothetical protein